KLEPCPFCGGEAERITIGEDEPANAGGDVIVCTRCEASSHVEFGRKENLVSCWNTRTAAQPQREAVLEAALLQCSSRFSAYAELHAEKLWDGSLSEAQRQTVRDKVDRNLRYAAEARAALTTPAPP